MAAAYEEFLKRIQEGLKREEEKERAEKEKAALAENNKQDEPPTLLSPEPEEEEEELPTICVPDPEEPEQVEHGQPSSLKELYDVICQQIRASGTLEIIMQDFQECRTDLDRVTYVSQLTELENLVIQEDYAKKNSDEANNYEKVYDLLIPNEASASKALDVIKKCIQKTPPEDVAALSVRYMKRGWAFLLLEQFSNAAVDAEKSLSFGCPEENLWNSHEILGHANAQQKDDAKAEHHFLRALENLRKSNTVNEVKATVTVRIMTVFKSIKARKGKKGSGKNTKQKGKVKPPQLSYGVHKLFPRASSALEFTVTKDRGRCVIAKRDIRPGDILIVEEPFCTMMNPDFLASHCYHCYVRSPVPIPCNSCAKVCYCSEECRAASWEGLHSKECKVLNHLIDPGIGKIALLAYRVLTKLTWSKLQKLREKIDTIVQDELIEACTAEKDSGKNSPEGMKWEGPYLPSDYLTILHLTSNSFKRSFGDLFKRAVTAVYLTKCLIKAGYFTSGKCSNDDMLFAASVVLRHLQGCSCNAYEIDEFQLGPNGVVDAKSNELGGALYPTVSLTNHACTSNAARYSVGDVCVLHAIRPIPKNSEVFDNYGFYYYLNTVNERQEVLMNQYKFKCDCEACDSMWSLYPHNPTETLIFRCPNCGQPCCYSNTSRSKCNMCSNHQQYSKLLRELEEQLIRYKDSIHKLREGDVQSCLPAFISHMEFIDKHVVLPVKHYSDLQEAIKQSYGHLGNFYNPNESVSSGESQPQQQQAQRTVRLKAGKNKYVNPNRR
ncbi:SET and MYND domain-containing protein 4-like [Macrobrachium rosenbergii]|uniref:SET and MYND domain-containing protein 4-like n=1 Tax=Macrobrachium rosenbergii TaxID=79674 RepID=UPI0034D5CDBD